MAKYKTRYGQPGIYNVTLPTIPDGEGGALAVDTNGKLITTVGVGASDLGKAEDSVHTSGDTGVMMLGVRQDSQSALAANGDYIPPSFTSVGAMRVSAQGTVADNAAAAGNPVIVGSVYNSSAQTYANADAANLQSDVNGYLLGRETYAPGYEDNTNNKAVVEHRYSYTKMTADTQVKASAGFIHTVTFSQTDAAPTAGSITIYDNTAESGTAIFEHTFDTTAFRPFTITLDVTTGTGIYVGFTTTADVSVTMSWR